MTAESSQAERKVGFFELQVRAFGFVIGLIFLVALMHNVIWNPDGLANHVLMVMGFMAVITSWCLFAKVGYYKVPGNKYHYCSILIMIFISAFALLIHFNI